MRTTEAIIEEGPGSFRLGEVPVSPVGPDSGLLRVEACGICGSDIEQYRGTLPRDLDLPYPFIPGHEPIGVIEEVGDQAARRWGVEPGDRVAVEAGIPCGHCRGCLEMSTICTGWHRRPFAYGLVPMDEPWGPTGAYARQMWLHPQTRLFKLPTSMPLARAAFFNPLSGAIAWAVHAGELQMGESVAIWGPGQRGLACLIAARSAGAGAIAVVGLGSDAHRLAAAAELGADATLVHGRDDVHDRIMEMTGGAGVDVALDVSAGATGPIREAIECVRPGGRVVLVGMKGRQTATELFTDDLVMRAITIRGAFATGWRATEQAVRLLETSPLDLDRLQTHAFPLEDAEKAIAALAGEGGERSIAVSIRPSGDLS